MKSSTEAIMLKRTTKESEIIMTTTTINAVAATETTGAVVIQAAVSKASVANAIFKDMFAMEQRPARKDMIQAAMKQAGLTEKGAATYLQNYKAKNGLVAKKETTVAA